MALVGICNALHVSKILSYEYPLSTCISNDSMWYPLQFGDLRSNLETMVSPPSQFNNSSVTRMGNLFGKVILFKAL